MTPTIKQVAEFLRGHGEAAMAFVVENLERQQQRDRQGLLDAIDAVNLLKAKYEPRQWRPPDHVARGRASD